MDIDIFEQILHEAIKDKKDDIEDDTDEVQKDDNVDDTAPDDDNTEEEENPDDTSEPSEEEPQDDNGEDFDVPDDDFGDDNTDSGDDTDFDNENPDDTTEDSTEELPEEDKLKSYNLLNNYVKMYNTIEIILDKITDLPKSNNDDENELLNSIVKNNNIIKRYIYQHICYRFGKNTYAENLYNFYQFKSSLEITSQMVEKIYNLRIKAREEDKQLNK